MISAAFADWAHYANIQFQQVASTASSQIDFSLGWIDGPGMILAQTSHPYSWTKFTSESIEFDSGEGWHLAGSQIVSNGGINLFKLALHEIGHAIGLAHYNATPAVMDPYLDQTRPSPTYSSQILMVFRPSMAMHLLLNCLAQAQARAMT